MKILWIEVDGNNPEIQLHQSYLQPTEKAIVVREVKEGRYTKLGIIYYETIANLD